MQLQARSNINVPSLAAAPLFEIFLHPLIALGPLGPCAPAGPTGPAGPCAPRAEMPPPVSFVSLFAHFCFTTKLPFFCKQRERVGILAGAAKAKDGIKMRANNSFFIKNLDFSKRKIVQLVFSNA